MENNKFWLTKKYSDSVIHNYEDELLQVTCIGLICYEPDIDLTALDIAHIAISKELDFNKIHGFYKMVIYNKKTGEYFFWGDNQGSQVFFIDTVAKTFSDSFISLRDARKGRMEPCYSSIAELFGDGYILSDETVIKGIFTTSLYNTYKYNNGEISSSSKGLMSFGENKGKSLSTIMQYLKNSMNYPICAVCTGGTDSRTILANLISQGVKPKLVITGHDDNPDIPIAKELSMIAECELTVFNSKNKEKDWIEKGFEFSDGQYEPLKTYRHYQVSKWAMDNRMPFEYGGVGGEFYKNDFCSLKHASDYPDILLSSLSQQKPWMGKAVLNELEAIRKKSEVLIQNKKERKLLCTCNAVGFEVLSKKTQKVTNICAPYVVRIDPLMDRDVIASASKTNPIVHSMAIWQRREIRKSFPVFCNIATDRGYSCSCNCFTILKEGIMKRGKNVVVKITKHLKTYRNKIIEGYWDKDYIEAKQSESFLDALDICKRIEVIKPEVTEDTLPLSITGEIILIGMIFKDMVMTK